MNKAERDESSRGSEKVARTFELLLALGTKGMSRSDIAGLLECDERTVYRYVKDINRASPDGEPLIRQAGGRYSLARSTELVEIIGGSYDERAAAAIASTPLGGLLDKNHGVPARVLEKVRAFIDVSRGNAPDPLLHDLFESLVRGTWISFDYPSEDSLKRHRCVPIRLYLDPVQIYLVAWDEEHDHLVCLATSKISDFRKEDGPPLAASAILELGNYCRSAWGKMIRHDEGRIAEARFEALPGIAPYFERNKLRLDQREEKRPDGSIVITLNVHNPVEFTRFMLRFGEGVRVLGDGEILGEMRDFTRAMARLY